ncbi:MAG: TerC family protein [Chloroflexota bacterium]
MSTLTSPEGLSALLALTVMEIVLGIDNVIFISILAGRLPESQRDKARFIGLGLAMLMRIGLLFSISWLASLTAPLVSVAGREFSGRDLILLLGGLFLIYKATHEIHQKLEGEEHATGAGAATASFAAVIVQILLLDIVFSLDSVLTAIGMADDLAVMIAAVVISVLVMLIASGPISRFVMAHPTVKMLALSFLLLIGTTLVAEGFHFHVERGYIYAAMGFSVLVELLNLRMSKNRKTKPVALHQPGINEDVLIALEKRAN